MCSSEGLRRAGLLPHGDGIGSSTLLFGPGAVPAPGEKVQETFPSYRKAALSSCWDTWMMNAMSSVAGELQTHARVGAPQ